MSLQRNQNDGNLKSILRRLYRLERQSMLSHSAIGREGLEVYDGGWIRILNGGLQVIGTATISGVLDVTGTFNASGDNNLSGTNSLTGPTTISGSLDVTGPTTISGTLGITGDTTVAGNFEITTGGLFKSGTVEIRPDGSADFGTLSIDPTGKLTSGLFELNPDGSAKFGDMTIDAGGKITTGETVIETTGKATFGDVIIDPSSPRMIQSPAGWLTANGPDSIGLSSSLTSSVNLNSSLAELNFGGSTVVRVAAREGGIDLSAPNVYASARLNVGSRLIVDERLIVRTMPTAAAGTTSNVYVDASGFFWKIP